MTNKGEQLVFYECCDFQQVLKTADKLSSKNLKSER